MKSESYFTIEHTGEAKVTEKMSRFLAFACSVSSVEEAKELIKSYQNKYHDSRHVCWAYMLGPERREWQLNDNGEPSGTAGKPILGQINSRELTDVCVVVVRYFGGIKLGTSGLIQAYRQAASEALDDAGCVEMFRCNDIAVTFPYVSADGVMKLAKSDGVKIISQEFGNTCELTIRVRMDREEEIMGRLGKLDSVIARPIGEGAAEGR